MEAEKSNVTFAQAIEKNEEVLSYLNKKEINDCLNPQNYTGHSEEIINKVLGSL